MALQCTITLPSGLVVTNAYIVLDRYSGNGPAIQGTLAVYVNAAAANGVPAVAAIPASGNTPAAAAVPAIPKKPAITSIPFQIPDATKLTHVTNLATAFDNLAASLYSYLSMTSQFQNSTVVA